MINPGMMMKLMNAKNTFESNHPKFAAFVSRFFMGGAITEGTIIEITITRPGEEPVSTNLKVQKSEMKIIFFDIDGTLICGGSERMSESTKEAIRIARANGHICMINTGRTKRLVGENLTGQVEFDGLLLGCGTEIEYHGKQLMHKTFSMEESKAILTAMKKYHVDAVLEGSREDYAPRGEEVFTETFRHMAREIENRKYDRYANAETPAGMDGMKRDLSEILDFIDREQGFYEIVPKGYSKATAIRYITDYLKIPMEDTVAIGDSNNDLPMLKYAHTSIAMGNSSKQVLETADYITTDVDKDGIWNALKWLGVLDK